MIGNEPKQALAMAASSMLGGAPGPTGYPWEDVLACPTCGARLRLACDKLFCASCRGEWPIVDGVPTFVEHFPYRSEIPLEPMSKVNTLIRQKNWRAVLLESEDASVRKVA